MRMILTCIGAWGRNEQQLGHPCQGRGLRPLGRPSIAVSGPAHAGFRSILALATLFVLVFAPASAQVQYDALSSYALRRVDPAYTGNLVQVRRSCDNATMMVGQTACGDLDTNAIKTFALANGIVDQLGSPAVGAYSLRRMRCGYTGPMIRVRRSCDNAQTDIGTNANGDLDTVALRNFVLGAGPLNMISTPANVAYSLRRLYCGYTGSAIRVRRSSDNAVQNIGFTVNGDLDTVALKNFVTTGSGFVTTWYDQSGNAKHLSQATAGNQPQIMAAGAILRQNGRPTVKFTVGSNFSSLVFSGTVTTGSAPFSALVVSSRINDNIPVFGWGANSWDGSRIGICSISGRQSLEIQNAGLSGSTAPAGVLDMQTWMYTSGGVHTGLSTFYNGAAPAVSALGANLTPNVNASGQIAMGTPPMVPGTLYALNGNVSEALAFTSVLSATDRQILEYLQSLYYAIPGPPVVAMGTSAANAFVSTWYDQSGNNRHVTQASTGLQPSLMSAGQLILTQANRPTVVFNGSQGLTHPYVLPTQPVSTSCVFRATALVSPGGELFGWGNNAGAYRRYGAWFSRSSATQGTIGVEQQGPFRGTTTLFNTNTWLISSQVLPGNSLNTLAQWVNGTAQALTSSGATGNFTISAGEFCLGNIPTAIGANQGHRGSIAEVIYFPSELSTANRELLEFSQASYYGISGPASVPLNSLPSVFVTSWLDQSGNDNLLAQVTNSRQPELMTFGVICRINGRPAIKGTNANQTNLTTIFPTAQVGSRLTANGIVQTDEGSNGNRRIMSLGNDLLNSSDWSNAANCNINQRNGNQFFIERNGVSPGFSATIGVPFAFSMRFSGTTRQLFNNGVGTATVGDGAAFDFRSLRLLQSINPCCEGSEALTGRMSEYGLYMRSLSETRRILLESNQGAYYGMAITGAKYALPTGSTYFRYVNGIGRESATDSVAATPTSAGMGLSVGTGPAGYLKDNGDYLTIGMSCPAPGYTTADLPALVVRRWVNDWYMNISDVGGNSGSVTLWFDHSDHGLAGLPDAAILNVLLVRSAPTGAFSVVPGATATVTGDRVMFTVDAALLRNNHYYTLGTWSLTILPVELLTFEAEAVDPAVDLSWITATESNNAGFHVERSRDGLTFERIGFVQGAGNSMATLEYTFTDQQPYQGISYYRLWQQDLDGQGEYGPVRVVELRSMMEVRAYPNPTTDMLILDNLPDEPVRIELLDARGVLVLTHEGHGPAVRMNLTSLPPAVYLVRVIQQRDTWQTTVMRQ